MSALGRLLSLAQLVEIFGGAAGGWTEARIRRLVNRQAIPFVKIGGRITFREAELILWLEEQTHRPAEPHRRAPYDERRAPAGAKASPREEARSRADRAAECAALGIPTNHRYS